MNGVSHSVVRSYSLTPILRLSAAATTSSLQYLSLIRLQSATAMDSMNQSSDTPDEVLQLDDPSRPTPEDRMKPGPPYKAKTNPPAPLMFSIGSAQACSTLSVSNASTRKRHRYFTTETENFPCIE